MIYPCKIIRYIRLKHGISIREMSVSMGISQARFSEIELENTTRTPYLTTKVAKGLSNIIMHRKENLTILEADFEKYKDILLEQKEGFS